MMGRSRYDVVAHLGSGHLDLPTKNLFIELRHTVGILIGHFKMNNGTHFVFHGYLHVFEFTIDYTFIFLVSIKSPCLVADLTRFIGSKNSIQYLLGLRQAADRKPLNELCQTLKVTFG